MIARASQLPCAQRFPPDRRRAKAKKLHATDCPRLVFAFSCDNVLCVAVGTCFTETTCPAPATPEPEPEPEPVPTLATPAPAPTLRLRHRPCCWPAWLRSWLRSKLPISSREDGRPFARGLQKPKAGGTCRPRDEHASPNAMVQPHEPPARTVPHTHSSRQTAFDTGEWHGKMRARVCRSSGLLIRVPTREQMHVAHRTRLAHSKHQTETE